MSLMPIIAPGDMTLTQQDSATSTTATITGPASIVAGDLLVLLDRATNSISVPTEVVPTGFTSITGLAGALHRQIASQKIADGSEASASITGMNGTALNNKVLYVFRGDQVIATVTASTPNAENTSGNPAAQNVTASAGTVPLIVFGCYGTDAGGTVDPRTFTPAKDGEITPTGNLLYLAFKIYNSAPQDTSIDMDDEGANNSLQSFYLECA